MLGAIIGDVIGSRFEFHNIKKKEFPLLTIDCRPTDRIDATDQSSHVSEFPEANCNVVRYGEKLHIGHRHKRPLLPSLAMDLPD